MKIYITDFYHIRYFKDNMIPIATTQGWPYWIYEYNHQQRGNYFVDRNNVVNGILEENLGINFGKYFEKLDEKCGEAKPCPYLDKVPNCQFMDSYYQYLTSLNFNNLLKEFERVAEDVRKINNYVGEPIIVLIVYESSKYKCAERPVLQRWFSDNGYQLEEWVNTEEEVF